MNTTKQIKVLHVTGQTWQGFKSKYDYSLNGHEPHDMNEALRLAGDFESLDSAEIVSTTIRRFTTTKQLKP